MKYGLAKWEWIGDTRYSLPNAIIADEKYNNLIDGLCEEYIFRCEEYPESENITGKFSSKEEVRQWMIDNMNMPEVSPFMFEFYPQLENMGIIIPQRLFTID